jgi:endothelin-converting enzyme/putative endopeptidase
MIRDSGALAAVALLISCATAGTTGREPVTAPGVDDSIIDRTTNPCADFYQFACGGWLARTEIPLDRPAWSRGFSEVNERNEATLREILEGAAEGRSSGFPYAQKLGDFFATCSDEPRIEEQGLGPLRAELKVVDSVNDAASLQEAIARLQGAGIGVPFTIGSDQDFKDATQVIATFDQGGLSLPDRDYYLSDDPKMQRIRQQFLDHIQRFLVLMGETPESAAGAASTVMSIEKELARVSMSRVDRRDPQNVYHRVDLTGLEKLAPHFDWPRLLTALGHPGITSINVAVPGFFSGLDELLGRVSIPEWRTYLRWHFASSVASALPKAFVDEDFRFASEALTGTKELPPRWKRCVRATSGVLGMALGRAYVQLRFSPAQKADTLTMVRAIEGALGADLHGLAWMDDATRARALEKLSAVNNKIGFPDVWRSYDKLTISRESYLRNALAGDANDVQYDLDKIGKPLDRTLWQMDPQEVNAYYNPSMNEMVFPAGILQPPFFTPQAPAAKNYGSIGMVMGHELTHGFDDEGRQFDARGNLSDWWTPASAKKFAERTECLAAQYDKYEPLPGVHLNGHLTLGENIADLGGTKLAYRAMQADTSSSHQTSAGEWSPAQLFFLGQAQSWCQKSREAYQQMLVKVDPHSPARFRVNGPLSNLPEFGKAWSCPSGAPMVRPPSERCEIW